MKKSRPQSLLATIVQHCDQHLQTGEIEDWDGAVNGLQVENDGQVTRIAAAVDASLATVQAAIESKADLLIVHHGLFWGPTVPWTGKKRELLQTLVAGNLAIYSSHLPLDVHPKLGNNALLCRALHFKRTTPFFFEKGRRIGLQSLQRMPRSELASRLTQVLGAKPILLPGGPETCQQIGVVTGGAGAELRKAASEGVDTFITGEGPHWTFPLAEELGLNVFYGGHYLTETFGVRALAAYLSKRFGVPWHFIDHPSGL